MRLDHSPFFRTTVGFDRLLDLLDQADGNAQGYPPYNIERSDENHYRVILAVAGFAEKDLGVEVRDGVLTVAGKREAEAAAKPSYLHQGIAGRAFERQFQLAEHVEVRGRAAGERPAPYRPGAHRAGGEKAPQNRHQRVQTPRTIGPRTIEAGRLTIPASV